MNNKKGFTLVELIVSFALITVVSLAFFRTILVLQQEQLKNIARNSYKAFTVVLNNSIQKDFLNNNIEKIISCGENCYDITYTANGIIRLSIDKENNTITYGGIKEKLPKDYKFINNIEFTSYINSYDGNDSYVALNINMKSNYEKNIENIKYVYQYDSDSGIIELDVDGVEAIDIIEYLFHKSPEEEGLYEPFLPDGTSAGIRYRGAFPNNYVYFNCEDKDNNNISYGEDNYNYSSNCEIWRIIGLLNDDDDKKIKIVKNENINKTMSWDSSDSSVNSGSGIAEWGQSVYNNGTIYEGSDLMKTLNTYYIGESNACTYCSVAGNVTCSNDCTSSVNQINNYFVNMIDDVNWSTNSIKYSDVLTPAKAYEQERNKEEIYINSVLHKATWTGKIGLINVSDYGYAGDNCTYLTEEMCGVANWLNNFDSSWTINHALDTDTSDSYVWFINENMMHYSEPYNNKNVFPSVYLKPNVTFISQGNGTEESPYILGMRE